MTLDNEPFRRFVRPSTEGSGVPGAPTVRTTDMTKICSTRSFGAAVEIAADAEALAALISGSDILLPLLAQVRGAAARRPTSVSAKGSISGWAPAGYDEIDRQMLDWIASHRSGASIPTAA
jgi:hypothetical protein